MGMNLNCMLYLQAKGILTRERNRLLDIGPQNVYFVTVEQIGSFLDSQGVTCDPTALSAEIDRLVRSSDPGSQGATTLLSEITDLSNIEYNSFDVCAVRKTEIIDLNFDRLPNHYFEYYDVVLNLGTTEHVFNQFNSFEIMHDATRIGGVIYCILPASGYLDHGYYCYTPVFFRDLVEANGYELVDMFFCHAGLNELDKLNIDVRTERQMLQPRSRRLEPHDNQVPAFNAHVVMRKTRSAPFRVGLEIATAHAAVNHDVAAKYGDVETSQVSQEMRGQAAMRTERDAARSERDELRAQLEAVKSSTSWHVSSPLRAIGQWLGRGRRG